MIVFALILITLVVYSYGFVDPNFSLSSNSIFQTVHKPLAHLVFQNRVLSGGVFLGIVISLFLFYLYFLKKNISVKSILFVTTVLIFSYPAFSYDIFNYILTAKVAYVYKENPYVVLPIEIPNEPMLAFTRASNKLALYGPTWLGISFLPHVLGMGRIWQTILSFKMTIAVFYFFLLWLIYKITKDMHSVIFFALNPLVLVEVLVSSHNDVVMMSLALAGIALGTPLGLVLLTLSIFVKGATVILLPLFIFHLIKPLSKDLLFRIAFWLMLLVFFLSPLREELYPWYAVWFLTFAAVIPWKQDSFVHNLCIALSFGLLLRYLPYLVTNSYAGWGPVLRIVFTMLPIIILFLWYTVKKRLYV